MCGVNAADMEAARVHTVVARTETDMVKELTAGQVVLVHSRWVAVGNKSVTYEQRMVDASSGEVHATQRVIEVFFDPLTRRSAPIPAAIRSKLGDDLTTSQVDPRD